MRNLKYNLVVLVCAIVGFLVLLAIPMVAFAQTYNEDVANIINENCLICHRAGGIGPMSFEHFDQVKPWAPLIAYKVARREMPPYSYDQNIGIQELQGDWRLEQEEIDTIVAWAEAGAPLGPVEVLVDVPNLPDLDEWNFADQFGQPNLIIPSVPIDIPATGNDLWHKHTVSTGLTVDRCIKAVQVRPRGDSKGTVHHANSSLEVDGERFGMLTEYAMGKWGEIVPDGVCRRLPANAQVAWDIHMFPGGLGALAPAPGTVLKDNVVEIGLWLYSEEESKELRYKQDLSLYQISPQSDIAIPPHGYLMTQGFHSFDHPVRIDSWQPHGHLRMNAASLEIFYPETGKMEAISQVSNWSATWHHSHLYEPDSAPLIPAGAVLVLKQWYDNTSDNKNNPDPDQWVVGGSRTGDEMTHGWMGISHFEGEEGLEHFNKLVAEKAARDAAAIASK